MPSKVVARRSAIHGTGVFAIAPIAKGERIIEYRGQRRTHDDVDAGDEGSAESGHTFLFTINDEFVIDGARRGNIAKWINHSCSPNCDSLIEESEGDDRSRDRVFIEAKKAIKVGEELTYNYGITLGEAHTAQLKKIWGCRCGSRNCTGTMLQPKRKPAPAARALKKAAKKTAPKATKKLARKAATKVESGAATKRRATERGRSVTKASRRSA
ncbi:SET domain-containing protein [Lysobacter lacus]|uniref:SET domain-containing protein n=1 Tax=Cognatilysobacter lacus TaxID=1643323 RepID=A0A5D8ZBS6_9GAMM|nr:SET domain-containing protein [Lysobacter lacus]